tara:strand:+ start:518 stop:649 length:132 start_codon:yes stop_codon:yes gene_type:complete
MKMRIRTYPFDNKNTEISLKTMNYLEKLLMAPTFKLYLTSSHI